MNWTSQRETASYQVDRRPGQGRRPQLVTDRRKRHLNRAIFFRRDALARRLVADWCVSRPGRCIKALHDVKRRQCRTSSMAYIIIT
ncbi:hypothetical protein EVAR_88297_1 [Eumeta japonica]|uniref:Uncharacterized protein n=1 Tax=Eumeta variegata TaxID=151549 RepID=A0A4C1VN73_EUMVA|nr:hypothetical protein EVAR_88297_1 [Eumeta japonica]